MMTTKKTVAKMTMTKSVMAVAAMTAVTVTSSESLARDGHGSRGQRQSGNRGGNDRLDLHGHLLVGAERGSLRDDSSLEALFVMRCDQGHAIGMTRGVRYLPHAWRAYFPNLALPDSKRHS